jgi:hypothetical protein
MTKFLSVAFALLALTLASGCISYSSTTRTVPAAEPAAVVTPVPPGTAIVAAPATTTTTMSVR